MVRVCVVIAMLLLAPSLRATVLLPADFREVVAGSQVIVHGRVLEVRPEWTADGRRIESVVTLEAGTYFKGGPGEQVTFRVEGGQIGRYKSVTIGAPVFSPGDEAVFFLAARGPSVPRIFGMGQGVFRVRVDAAGQRTVVTPALLSSGHEHEVLRRGAPDRRALPIEAFAAQVRQALAQPAAAPRGAR